jgi:hypothetical protein
MQKKIILLIILLFFLSSAWLFSISKRAIDPDYNKNFWTLSFSNPKNDDLNFVIENHSDRTDFHWEVLKDKEKLKEGDIKIEKGKNAQVQPSSAEPQSSSKITIRVSSGDQRKEIYKNFDK